MPIFKTGPLEILMHSQSWKQLTAKNYYQDTFQKGQDH